MNERLIVHTRRLELVAFDSHLLELAFENRRELARELNASVPKTWPPAVMMDTLDMHLVRLETDPSLAAGWLTWGIIVCDADGGRTLAGTVGFSGRPDSNRSVHLGFSIIPEFEGLGFVTEAAHALVDWAFRQPGVKRITAQAHAQHVAYVRVLQRLGMVPAEPGKRPGFVMYSLDKETAAINSAN